jgi:hypothetical protein
MAETTAQASVSSIETEINKLEKNLQNYKQRRSNLLEALELGEFDKNEVLDRLNSLKYLREQNELKLKDIVKIRDNLANLTGSKIKLNQLYNRVIENLQNADIKLKRLALDALDIKVFASTNHIEVQGMIPLELPTTARTSG